MHATGGGITLADIETMPWRELVAHYATARLLARTR